MIIMKCDGCGKELNPLVAPYLVCCASINQELVEVDLCMDCAAKYQEFLQMESTVNH